MLPRRPAFALFAASLAIAGCNPPPAISPDDLAISRDLAAPDLATLDLTGYTLHETILVDSGGALDSSRTRLVEGLTYRIRVSGTVVTGGPGFGDAEYVFNEAQTEIINGCGGNGTDLGLAVDDPVVRLKKDPNWGPYNPAHVYEIQYKGRGERVALNYHDCVFVDNRGSLTVEIFHP